MSTHAVSSQSRKPKNLLKSVLAATAAVWFVSSDEQDRKSAYQSPKCQSSGYASLASTEVSGVKDERQKNVVANFLVRPRSSSRSDAASLSLNTYYRSSKKYSIAVPQIQPPLRISRAVYSREFHELGKLGSGAFGTVFRSLNILDGTIYAIKKIFLPFSLPTHDQRTGHDAIESIDPFSIPDHIRSALREPQVMATICKHRNTVRYHHSWLEILPNDDTWSSAPTVTELPSSPYLIDAPEPSNSDWTDGYSSEEEEAVVATNRNGSTHTPAFSLVLFIQMELCTGASLYDWLRLPGRTVDGTENTKLFKQLILGLSHLHAKGYCHRDVKPANLLIVPKDGQNKLKVGDFGCCKRLNTENQFLSSEGSFVSHSPSPAPSTDEHTEGCGTYFYMAPELHTKNYDTAVDIFAAGIVLFELYHVFATDMERITLLKELHEKRIVPRDFIKSYPTQAYLVLKMTHADPKQRPTAFELLNSPRFGLSPVQYLDSALPE